MKITSFVFIYLISSYSIFCQNQTTDTSKKKKIVFIIVDGGYNSLLTGVWVNKHNVFGNSIKKPNYNYPTIFRLLKDAYPNKKTAIFSTWLDNRTKLVGENLAETRNIKIDYSFDGLELDEKKYPHDEDKKYLKRIDGEVAREAYTNQNNVKLEGNNVIEQIMIQKHIALFLNSDWQMFFERRRTGYPAYAITNDINGGVVPKRFLYPSSEINNNGENLEAAISSQFGGDESINDLIWLIK